MDPHKVLKQAQMNYYSTMLNLKHNLKFEDLYSTPGLQKLDKIFLQELSDGNPELYQKLMLARGEDLEPKEESKLIIDLAPHVEDFISHLFSIEKEVEALSTEHHKLAPLFKCKRLFVQRKAAKSYKPEDEIDESALADAGIDLKDELSFATHVNQWLEEGKEDLIEAARRYAGWAVHSEEGKARYRNGVLFKIPNKIDNQNLVHTTKAKDGSLYFEETRDRDGFNLTDEGYGLDLALDNANYCIFCHNQEKDSCSHGIKNKETEKFKVNELSVTQAGCPLDEKISEMNFLKTQGSVVGALATVIIDNPMVAATGHRICNDCMKGCIYQKQDPVNIPQVETKTLDHVLHLPWGFEIYSLLTRWNPLNFKRPVPKESDNRKVLVAGLGPAGFTLSHHLLNQGHTVVGIDGLKIEPLSEEILTQPIKNVKEIYEDLGSRTAAGFGGVAEYGITVRWDKNYLKIIRLLLERRANFRMYGGVRFGGTITYDKAWELGFDHIALALGAGRPNLPQIPNILSNGVRTASDFLMSLQLTGAARDDSIANLQVRLPVAVIGGGLTAIDAATESLAYYPLQVEKFLKRYEVLGDSIFNDMTEEEKEVAKEQIEHAKELRANPDKKLELLKQWGGVTLAYRRSLQESPSYRLNHEEVEKAFEEGIHFAEHITPEAIELDEYGSCKGIRHEHGLLEAKTVLIAAGTTPNTVLAREDGAHFELDGKYFKAVNVNGEHVSPERVAKPEEPQILMSVENDKGVSFFGDLHPSYAGNVVKAMGSAKQGYPIVSDLLTKHEPTSYDSPEDFFAKMDDSLIARVEEVIRLTPKIIEVVIKAPLAAQEFKPGMFYRLQNYETHAKKSNDTTFAMEGLALTGAWADKEKGLLSIIILEMGGSSDLCQHLEPGEPIVLMGPTGTPTEIPENEMVMLVGGGLGNAVLFSIGKALKENGCKVIYFAGYKEAEDTYREEDIEAASDVVVWCCDEKELPKRRDQDMTFHGNIVDTMKFYSEQNPEISLDTINRMIVIGSDGMMNAVTYARHNDLKHLFKTDHVAIGSINSPMQCMMKEICAQCLQRHVDPMTGEESYVYSCFNQDQLLDRVDFKNLNDRLRQNSMQEKVCAKWIEKELVA